MDENVDQMCLGVLWNSGRIGRCNTMDTVHNPNQYRHASEIRQYVSLQMINVVSIAHVFQISFICKGKKLLVGFHFDVK